MNEIIELEKNNIPAISAAAVVEQSRAVAETQAAMVVAQGRPRDEFNAYNKIIKACARPSLAGTAMYAYRRGGTLVEGPSIRLAEVLARAWGNITYGIRETSRSGNTSEIEAFAWDLESNVRVTRQFVLKHARDTKKGAKALTSERDIYELAANMGQRRVRACLLELIPGDIVDGAVMECKKTLAKGDGRPMEDRVRDMVAVFDELGVTQDMIEGFLQHKVSAIVPTQLVKLQGIYKSIKDGVADRSEFFEIGGVVNDLNKKFAPPEKEQTTDTNKDEDTGQQDGKEPTHVEDELKKTAADFIKFFDKNSGSLEAVDKWKKSNQAKISELLDTEEQHKLEVYIGAVVTFLKEQEDTNE